MKLKMIQIVGRVRHYEDPKLKRVLKKLTQTKECYTMPGVDLYNDGYLRSITIHHKQVIFGVECYPVRLCIGNILDRPSNSESERIRNASKKYLTNKIIKVAGIDLRLNPLGWGEIDALDVNGCYYIPTDIFENRVPELSACLIDILTAFPDQKGNATYVTWIMKNMLGPTKDAKQRAKEMYNDMMGIHDHPCMDAVDKLGRMIKDLAKHHSVDHNDVFTMLNKRNLLMDLPLSKKLKENLSIEFGETFDALLDTPPASIVSNYHFNETDTNTINEYLQKLGYEIHWSGPRSKVPLRYHHISFQLN